jgi:oxygen-independent coproporphyrinogen-3 oxidase
MLPAKFLWKPAVQKVVTGRARRFQMAARDPQWPRNLVAPGLYLHIPFCKNLCPFCPYNRTAYDEDLFAAYEQAVKEEITLYADSLQGYKFTSLYVGGGTPTVNWSGLVRILNHMRDTLAMDCDICVELHPANMEADCLEALKDAGVTKLSIGVESTSDEILNRIGRNHDSYTALSALERALNTGFKSVNADLMFSLPEQTIDEWHSDLSACIKLGVDQLSTYPLFSFPYSDLGRTRRISQVTRPPSKTVRAMLDLTDTYCEEQGLHRCAVWSWIRAGKSKFSSITRHHYVGFGPSAATMTPDDFYVNTFDVPNYVSRLPQQRPVALSMPLTRRTEMGYWLYWRIYELAVRQQDFSRAFGVSASIEQQFGRLFRPLVSMGFMAQDGVDYTVTKRGAYWIHRLQNEYSLNYINRLWGACRREPWPALVTL